jgi:hypothetical protein
VGTGGATELRDASADATADATSSDDPCALSSIEEYCQRRLNDCPSLADARFSLRARPFENTPRRIVQRSCTAADGSPRISVGAGSWNWSKTFIYDAQTQQLLGVTVTDDTGCHGRMYLNEDNFGSVPGYYGEKSRDCGFVVPKECGWSGGPLDVDAGPVDGGDAGQDLRNNECILAP